MLKQSTPVPSAFVTVRTLYRLHQRDYVRDLVLGQEDVGEAGWRWLYPELEAIASAARVKPLAHQTFTEIRRGLGIVNGLTEWARVSAGSASDLTAEQLVALFSALERALQKEEGLSSGQRARISSRTRTLLLTAAQKSSADHRLARSANLYRSVLKARPKPRALISDLPSAGRSVLGAVGHTSHQELREATKSILVADLERVKAVCADVLDRYDAALSALEVLRGTVVDAETERSVQEKLLAKGRSALDQIQWSDTELDAYLALLSQMDIGLRQPFRRPKNHDKRRLHPGGAHARLYARTQGMGNGTIGKVLILDIACPGEVLLACALILQIHTSWNFISVLELDRECIEVKSFPHRLQSKKPRTSDETPISFVERSDELTIRAMKCLAARWDRLMQMGRVPPEEKGLWISSRAIQCGGIWPLVSWREELRAFTQKYGLPSFSLEQVRVQCLAVTAVGARGVGGVVQAAGHSGTATSIRYIDQLLLRRLNSASLLEFERRLEGAVHYMTKAAAAGSGDLEALPIGDGTSCVAPNEPPDLDWLDAGVYRAENCHQGDGCRNRRIQIDEERIEEVLRTKRYYAANWSRLADENLVSFERIHAPQLLFNLALYGAIRKGPYRHIVSRYEKQVG